MANGKTGDAHTVWLDDDNRRFLPERGDRDESVFPLPLSGALTRILRRWAAAAGVEKRVHFHSARHSAAARCTTEHGVFIASKLLGHRNVHTTQASYGHFDPEQLKVTAGMLARPTIDSGTAE